MHWFTSSVYKARQDWVRQEKCMLVNIVVGLPVLYGLFFNLTLET